MVNYDAQAQIHSMSKYVRKVTTASEVLSGFPFVDLDDSFTLRDNSGLRDSANTLF